MVRGYAWTYHAARRIMLIKNSDNTTRNRTQTFKPVVPLYDNESNILPSPQKIKCPVKLVYRQMDTQGHSATDNTTRNRTCKLQICSTTTR